MAMSASDASASMPTRIVVTTASAIRSERAIPAQKEKLRGDFHCIAADLAETGPAVEPESSTFLSRRAFAMRGKADGLRVATPPRCRRSVTDPR